VAVRGFCVGYGYAPIRTGAVLDLTKAKGCLGSRRSMYTACVSRLDGFWIPSVHAVCQHNEYAALVKRTLGPTPEPGDSSCRLLKRSFGRLCAIARRYRGSRWAYLETAHSYTGALRRRYLEAERSLMVDGPVSSGDCRIKAFLKAEKCAPWKVAKPRMIFPRSPRYNLHVASWLKPFEHWLWGNLKSGAISGVGNSRVCAKGLNPVQRANLIVRKMSAFKDPVVFEVDGKAFEAHVSTRQLELEHSVYLAAYGGDEDLARALSKQLFNHGTTACGAKFGRAGGRASGDFNTGMGNSLIMLAVVRATMFQVGCRQWDTLVDGDNALLFLPRTTARHVHANFAAAALHVAGHEMVLERAVENVESITFGQSKPIRSKGGWKMVREWRKVISHGTSSHRHLHEPRFAREYIAGVARCEAALADGVPILWAWSNNLLAQTSDLKNVRVHALVDYQMLGLDLDRVLTHPKAAEQPSSATRESFARAFDISPDDQVRLEGLLLRDKVVVQPVKEWDRDFQCAWSAR